MQGEIPKPEEIREEFRERQQKIKTQTSIVKLREDTNIHKLKRIDSNNHVFLGGITSKNERKNENAVQEKLLKKYCQDLTRETCAFFMIGQQSQIIQLIK